MYEQVQTTLTEPAASRTEAVPTSAVPVPSGHDTSYVLLCSPGLDPGLAAVRVLRCPRETSPGNAYAPRRPTCSSTNLLFSRRHQRSRASLTPHTVSLRFTGTHPWYPRRPAVNGPVRSCPTMSTLSYRRCAGRRAKLPTVSGTLVTPLRRTAPTRYGTTGATQESRTALLTPETAYTNTHILCLACRVAHAHPISGAPRWRSPSRACCSRCLRRAAPRPAASGRTSIGCPGEGQGRQAGRQTVTWSFPETTWLLMSPNPKHHRTGCSTPGEEGLAARKVWVGCGACIRYVEHTWDGAGGTRGI